MMKGLIVSVFLLVVTTGPASALWIEWPNGSYTYVPNELIILAAIVALGGGLAAAFSSSSSVASFTVHDPDGLDSAEHYDSEAARFRALSRKLDAETDLAESVIKAKRTRAELHDVEELFRDRKSRRR
jgi:hypothetical protein